ncbi:MAG: glycosyltransferase family 1 protein, partial [Archangium sp.]|nr:glycosyltransferase family 1 protein [Archangium sp.]
FEPTGEFPAPLVAPRPLPFAFLNRATWGLFRMVAAKVHRETLGTFRRELGLPPIDCVVSRAAKLKVPVLQLWSALVVPHARDAGPLTQTTGFVRLQDSVRQRLGEGTIDPALMKWLGDGPAPVYVGFGSMPVPALEDFGRELLHIGRALKLRFVLCGGWNDAAVAQGLGGEALHVVPSVDHGWLFPKCAAVVHHGGAGSTAAGVEAGVPSVICAYFADQPFWGARLQQLGVGTTFAAARHNTARLTQALQEVLTDDVRARAAKLGQALRAEQGTQAAVDALAQLAGAKSRAAA